MSFFKRIIIPILSISILFSCTGNGIEPDNVRIEPSLELQFSEVSGAKGYMFVNVEASGQWELKLEYEQETTEPWASLSQTSGKDTKKAIVLSYQAYSGASGRTLEVVLSASGKAIRKSLYQQGRKKNVTMQATAPVSWIELPETNEKDGLDWGLVEMASTPGMRSYSYYWDYDNMVAHWVAYPLNRGLIGAGSGRTDAWGLDPNLPQGQQPVLYRSWGVGWLDRGHQIPSADRLRDGDNQQTFYGTNMTPQIGKNFNQGIWAKLEGKVRSWSDKYDTLYVVTGCVVKQNSTQGKYNQVGGYVFDNDRKRVAVPTAYYKAVLGYKASSSTYGYGGYCGAAIYYDHEDIYDTGIYASDLISIRELEEKLGYKLFVNLSKKISEEQVEKVKIQDPSKVAVWK